MQPPKVSELTKDTTFLGRKDAFHFPGILVKSRQTMTRGDTVKFTDTTFKEVVDSAGVHDCEAIVDPFLEYTLIAPGNLFWVFIKPNLVSNLVHSFEIEKVNNDPWIDCSIAEEEDDGNDDEEDDSCKGCYS